MTVDDLADRPMFEPAGGGQRGARETEFHLAHPALHVLDQAPPAAVQAASPAIVRVDRRRGAGTGIAWAADLVVSASFHELDATLGSRS